MCKTVFIALPVVGLLAMAGCKDASSGVEASASNLNIPGVADDAAFKIMGSSAHLFRCGDRYFTADAYSIDELKDPTFEIAPRELTQADTLNGVTWYAIVTLRAPALRTYGSWGDGEHWGKWVNNGNPLWLSEFMVKDGSLEQAQDIPSSKVKAFSCSSIPPG